MRRNLVLNLLEKNIIILMQDYTRGIVRYKRCFCFAAKLRRWNLRAINDHFKKQRIAILSSPRIGAFAAEGLR